MPLIELFLPLLGILVLEVSKVLGGQERGMEKFKEKIESA